MRQVPAWSKLLRSALVALVKKAVTLVSAKSDTRRIRSTAAWWVDLDFAKMRFRGGRSSRFDQN